MLLLRSKEYFASASKLCVLSFIFAPEERHVYIALLRSADDVVILAINMLLLRSKEYLLLRAALRSLFLFSLRRSKEYVASASKLCVLSFIFAPEERQVYSFAFSFFFRSGGATCCFLRASLTEKMND